MIDYTASVEHRVGRGMFSEATVKVQVGDEVFHEVAEGNGPVNAMNLALRKAIQQFYPRLAQRASDRLQGAHSRQHERHRGHGARPDRLHRRRTLWSTVGASTNIIEASWIALSDGVEYFILTDAERQQALGESRQEVASVVPA